jgi:hypothetical protein
VWEISGLAISGLRKKLAGSTSANPQILGSILTNLHLETQMHTYWFIINICFFFFFSKMS